MDRALKCDHSLQSCCALLYCLCFLFNFTQFAIFEHLSILDLALSVGKAFKKLKSFYKRREPSVVYKGQSVVLCGIP